MKKVVLPDLSPRPRHKPVIDIHTSKSSPLSLSKPEILPDLRNGASGNTRSFKKQRRIEPHRSRNTLKQGKLPKPQTKSKSFVPSSQSIGRRLPIAVQPQTIHPANAVNCPVCRKLVHPLYLQQHLSEAHSKPELPAICKAQYSFVILPPGAVWHYQEVFEHYKKRSRAHQLSHNDIDLRRTEQIEKLNSTFRGFGVKEWFGYAVYGFEFSTRVVLECPKKGNATYVLWGDWEGKISLSKGELRHKHAGHFQRVTHSGDWTNGEWINKVKRALRE